MTSTLIADRADRTSQTAIDLLLSRRSHWPLSAPAPTQQQLQHIFDAAMRAPDHGRLRPWRLITIRDEARHAFGDVLVDLAAARAPDEARSAHEHRRQRAMAAPLIIALVAAVDRSSSVPELEQLLCVGAAAMNMLNAIHLYGYGGFWATGIDTYEPAMHRALGLDASERLLGFLFVGTPQKEKEGQLTRRPSSDAYVREWQPIQCDAARA
ncbi:UNVERIFIED_ORG: nitroreductase [Burkholderia sp. CF145]|uniref:nitroreductase family protein n=1 Tax=Paraburkholderia hospita TaxID=169430 RepID=UPI0002719CE1|nr:nitroreductase [Paraburkholderia hospita]EUC16907.1 nitroreductase [Burkholderia sp. BT03]SKD03666.1 Nitroreductase [Paraburkholderia hospita]